MAETIQSLDQLSALKPAAPRRRNTSRSSTSRAAPMRPASARMRSPACGSSPVPGKIQINERSIEVYFARPVLRMLIQQPLVASNRNTQYDIVCTVSGGGLSGRPARFATASPRRSLFRARSARRPQARRLPDPRLPRGRAQEVRPRQGPAFVPVLQALTRVTQKYQRGAGAPLLYLQCIRRGFTGYSRAISGYFRDVFVKNRAVR